MTNICWQKRYHAYGTLRYRDTGIQEQTVKVT